MFKAPNDLLEAAATALSPWISYIYLSDKKIRLIVLWHLHQDFE